MSLNYWITVVLITFVAWITVSKLVIFSDIAIIDGNSVCIRYTFPVHYDSVRIQLITNFHYLYQVIASVYLFDIIIIQSTQTLFYTNIIL